MSKGFINGLTQAECAALIHSGEHLLMQVIQLSSMGLLTHQ